MISINRILQLTVLVLLFLSISCDNSKQNESQSRSQESETQLDEDSSPEEAIGESVTEYSIKLNDHSIPLNISETFKEYAENAIPDNLSLNSSEITVSEQIEANLLYFDSAHFYLEFNDIGYRYMAIYDWSGENLATSLLIDPGIKGFSSASKALIAPGHFRLVYTMKDDSKIYKHYTLDIDSKKIIEVSSPKTVLDYFVLLPEKYLSQYFNGHINLYPNLFKGSDWYHTFISKSYASVVDFKNGYLKLISTMAVFQSDQGHLFVLNNSAGGTCETFIFNYFLKYDQEKRLFTEIEPTSILPDINKYDLFMEPAEIEKHFKVDEIALWFKPPQFGTVMSVDGFIDECGIDDESKLTLITNKKTMKLKWNKVNSKFEILE
ncbi:MAG: hypothetical protein RLN79_06950 [Cytophagales bacterium]